MTRTVELVPPAGQPQMEGLFTCPAEREGDTTLEGIEGNSREHSNIETLPAIKEGIDRPISWSQDCDGGTHRRQQDAASQVGGT